MDKNSRKKILIYPGWATVPADWRAWLVLTAGKVEFEIADWGYFGPPKEPAQGFQPDIIIAHSYGAHKIDPARISEETELVLISTFKQFLPESKVSRGRMEQVLKKTRSHLVSSPKGTLQAFYKRCAHPAHPGPMTRSDPYVAKLLEDHQEMESSQLDVTRWSKGKKVTLLHGRQDAIVPLRQAQLLHEMVPGSTLVEIDQAGHSLPFTHAPKVLDVLNI